MSPIEFDQQQQQQQQQRFDRLSSSSTTSTTTSSKRKFDDSITTDEEDLDLISSIRMKRHESETLTSSCSRLDPNNNLSNPNTTIYVEDDDSRVSDLMKKSSESLHFFVKNICRVGGTTIVIHANPGDLIESVLEKIQKITGIPASDQRLIYRGKQLEERKTLSDYAIQNDAGLQLVGRMRSTGHPRSWQLVNDMVSDIYRLCTGGESLRLSHSLLSEVKEFMNMIPRDDMERAAGHLHVFKSADVPSALMVLLLSPIKGNKEIAEESIELILSNIEHLPKLTQNLCASMLLEFCRLLFNDTKHDDKHDELLYTSCRELYTSCRNKLGILLQNIAVAHDSRYFEYAKDSVIIEEFLPFVKDLSCTICEGLESNVNSLSTSGEDTEVVLKMPLLLTDIQDFTAFMLHIRRAIEYSIGGKSELPIKNLDDYANQIRSLFDMFLEMLAKINGRLKEEEHFLVLKGDAGKMETEGQCLSLMRELNSISKLFDGAPEKFASVMKSRRVALNSLIKYVKRGDDHRWVLDYKDVTDFESRRHLALLLLPEVREDYNENHEMLIDRLQILPESFEYIAREDPASLRNGLFMEFKNEEASGPGVLREWFCILCHHIFNRQHPLFLACANDQRRFFPNPASKVDPMHLDYFGFCGRVIALALMHKIQVGIVFDRLFFLQLAEQSVCLEDIRDADPCLYLSCKKILEMDTDIVDSDALGLTFVRDIEELGERKVVELCPGGKDIVVNSKNREKYVDSLIKHCFVTSISEQVARFVQGFDDIVSERGLRKLFFKGLDLEDFDRILYGSNGEICVKDWKAHTDYRGFKDTDIQICWFWKVVEDMSTEQRRVLLFFWTSVKYLPSEGFGGLGSRLCIVKTHESQHRLPSSHTCFYQICFPPYPSNDVMQNFLRIITQEHISCSFGTY